MSGETVEKAVDGGQGASSVDPAEVAKFDRMAAQWWDLKGEAAPLHALNPVRLGYIRDIVVKARGLDPEARRPFSGLRLLDVGCGGGLLSEPLARLGGAVTGIDAAAEGVAVARAHAVQSDLSIDYRETTAEALLDSGEGSFDVVCALEIVEHVADPAAFLKTCARLVAPGGQLFVSTLNRTPRAYAVAIAGAEHLLRWLPAGTHDWNKFLKPEEVRAPLTEEGLHVEDPVGLVFDLPTRQWRLGGDVGVNYMLTARR